MNLHRDIAKIAQHLGTLHPGFSVGIVMTKIKSQLILKVAIASLLGILAIFIYWRMVDNFFYYDDFDWLDKVRGLGQKPLSILNPVVHPPTSYFSPLIYIVFWINYSLFGLDPFAYHLLSLILHILNSCLVVYLTFSISNNLTLAILAGLFFTTSFAITDAVLWPAAYVDIMMFFFFILSLIFFAAYLKNQNKYGYLLCLIFFILSLSAKGTALVLPISLFLIERYLAPPSSTFKMLKYMPFALIAAVYLALTRHYSSVNFMEQVDLGQIVLNIFNIPILFFVPEGILPVGYWGSLMFLLILIPLVILTFKKVYMYGIALLGFLLMMVGLLPLAPIAWSFPANPDPLTESIRHRLYLGSMGSAMLIGAFFCTFYRSEGNPRYKTMASMLLIAFIGFNIFWNQKIQSRWEKVTDDTRNALTEFKRLAEKYPPGSRIYFINFPPNQGFKVQFFKLYFETSNLDFATYPKKIPPDIDIKSVNFLIQLNGHIYNSPEEAARFAVGPWDHYYVAEFYILTGKHEKGLIELERATSFKGDEKLHYFAAISYRDLGVKFRAIEELKKAISINKSYAKAQRLLDEVE